MNRHEADRLITVIRELVEEKQLPAAGKPAPAKGNGEPPAEPRHVGKLAIDTDQLEAIYRVLKARLLDDLRTDPVFLKLLSTMPELVVEIEPQLVTLEGTTTKGRVASLIAREFFKTAKQHRDVVRELERTGPRVNNSSVSAAIADLKAMGFLTSDGDAYVVAPGLKVSERRIER